MSESPNKQVSRWRPIIHEVRELLGLDESAYPDDVVLALIDVESDGDPNAQKFEGTQFHGLLQMGRPAGIDTGLDDEGVDTTEELHGDGHAALQEFFEYQERYSRRHAYSPDRIAALWKGGPGTAATIAERLVADDALDTAIGYAAEEHGIPRLPEYVRRFREARKVWREWLAEQDEPTEACFPLD